MELLYLARNIKISYEQVTGILYCKWIGFQEKELMMKTDAIIFAILKEKKVSKVLNDHLLVTGPWYSAAAWTAQVWFPAMVRAGLKHFAWIVSPNIFAEVSARKAMQDVNVVKTFNVYDEAYQWLLAQND